MSKVERRCTYCAIWSSRSIKIRPYELVSDLDFDLNNLQLALVTEPFWILLGIIKQYCLDSKS